MNKNKLGLIQSFLLIISSIMTPILIAVIGWYIQHSISERSLEKDYMAIAVSVLNNPNTKENINLRSWAVDFISKKSPLQMNDAAKSELKNNLIIVSRVEIPPNISQPCQELPKLENNKGADILPYILELHSQYKDCAARHKALVKAWPK